MSDTKSKLPDFKELTAMANKFFSDVKKSVTEIVNTYQQERAEKKPETTDSDSDSKKP